MKAQHSVPSILWIAIVAMGIFSIIHLMVSFSNSNHLFAFMVNVVLVLGLFYLKKWAYILTIISSLIAPVLLLFQTTGFALIILLLNSIVIIPLLLSTKYFFPNSNLETNNQVK